MTITWLIILIIYGCVMGFDFSPLFWWLLLATGIRDGVQLFCRDEFHRNLHERDGLLNLPPGKK